MTSKEENILLEVKKIFNTLNYEMVETFDHKKFYQCALKTISRCLTIQDIKTCLNCILQFQRLFKDFVSLALDEDNLVFFNRYTVPPFEIKTLDEKDAINKYCMTNALTLDNRKFFLTSENFNGEYISYASKMYEIKLMNYKISLPHGKQKDLLVYDRDDEHVLTVKLDNGKLVLPLCKLDLYVTKVAKVMRVYRLSYINSLNKRQKLDDEHAVAYLDCDMLNDVNQLGLVRYHLRDNDFDREILDILSLSYLVLSIKK